MTFKKWMGAEYSRKNLAQVEHIFWVGNHKKMATNVQVSPASHLAKMERPDCKEMHELYTGNQDFNTGSITPRSSPVSSPGLVGSPDSGGLVIDQDQSPTGSMIDQSQSFNIGDDQSLDGSNLSDPGSFTASDEGMFLRIWVHGLCHEMSLSNRGNRIGPVYVCMCVCACRRVFVHLLTVWKHIVYHGVLCAPRKMILTTKS